MLFFIVVIVIVVIIIITRAWNSRTKRVTTIKVTTGWQCGGDGGEGGRRRRTALFCNVARQTLSINPLLLSGLFRYFSFFLPRSSFVRAYAYAHASKTSSRTRYCKCLCACVKQPLFLYIFAYTPATIYTVYVCRILFYFFSLIFLFYPSNRVILDFTANRITRTRFLSSVDLLRRAIVGRVLGKSLFGRFTVLKTQSTRLHDV